MLVRDGNNCSGWVVILILFDARFRTERLDYFNFVGMNPFIYQLKANSTAAWDAAYQFVVNWGGDSAKVTFPEVVQLTAYQDAMLSHPWQKAVWEKLCQGPERSKAGPPIINCYYYGLHHSINEFCQWIQFRCPHDVILFPSGVGTEASVKRELRKCFIEGKTGKILIIMVFETKFHANPKWMRSSNIIQMLRYGSLTQGWTPEAILIFSGSAITYGETLSEIGTRTLNLDKQPELLSIEGQIDDDYSAAVQLLDQAPRIGRSKSKYEQQSEVMMEREGAMAKYEGYGRRQFI